MWQCIVLLLFAVLAVPSSLRAAPASPDPIDIQQPDGSTISIKARGDEFQNWTESGDTGHTILRNPASGYWEYAEQDRDGSLRGSGIRVLPRGANAPAHIPKPLKPPRNRDLEQRMRQLVSSSYDDRIAGGAPSSPPEYQAAPGDWNPAPVSGAKKLLVVLVSFANRAIATTPSSWSTAVFDTAAISVAKYYQENSFSNISISPAPHTQPGNPAGVVSVTLGTNHPNNATSSTFAVDQTWGNSALQQAAPFVDFNSFDTNSDGKLDTSELVIYFVVAGYEHSGGSGLTPSVWAHAWWTTGTGLTAGTKNVQRWALNGEYYNNTTQMTMGVIVHELGHQMCGLPDLYDVSDRNEAMGNFSVMAGGSWGANSGGIGGSIPTVLDAWSREYLGWGTPGIPASGGSVSIDTALSSASAALKLVAPAISTTEYFLVENRHPSGWDLGLKRFFGSGWLGGLLITHIDTTAGTQGSNDINSYDDNYPAPGHQGVVPVQASTAACDMLAYGSSCRGHATTLFYAANNANWSTATTPNSNYYSGSASGFGLSGISAPGASMTATVSLPAVMRTVSVAKSGAGSGSVTSAPAGLSCGPTCEGMFEDGNTVVLTATAGTGSLFTGWSGAGCSGTGDCTISVTADTNVTAAFAIEPGSTVGVSTGSSASYFQTLGAAFAAISPGQTVTVPALALTFTEDLTLSAANASVTLIGGYDSDFATISGATSLRGSLTITGGNLSVSNLEII